MNIELDTSFLVGHDMIDRDHRELVGLVLHFFEAIKRGADKHAIYDAIDIISVKFAAHFERENELMVGARYTDLQAHVAEHRTLLGDLGKFLHTVDEATDDDLQNVAKYLDDWVVKHAASADRKLAKFLRDRTTRPTS